MTLIQTLTSDVEKLLIYNIYLLNSFCCFFVQYREVVTLFHKNLLKTSATTFIHYTSIRWC